MLKMVMKSVSFKENKFSNNLKNLFFKMIKRRGQL